MTRVSLGPTGSWAFVSTSWCSESPQRPLLPFFISYVLFLGSWQSRVSDVETQNHIECHCCQLSIVAHGGSGTAARRGRPAQGHPGAAGVHRGGGSLELSATAQWQGSIDDRYPKTKTVTWHSKRHEKAHVSWKCYDFVGDVWCFIMFHLILWLFDPDWLSHWASGR